MEFPIYRRKGSIYYKVINNDLTVTVYDFETASTIQTDKVFCYDLVFGEDSVEIQEYEFTLAFIRVNLSIYKYV